MAGIGLYGVYYSVATKSGGVVTGYSGVETMGKAINVSFEPNEGDSNDLYANNAIAESDATSGSGGTITFTLDRLTEDAAADLFGLTKTSSSVTVNSTTVSGTGFDYTGEEQANSVGVAFIIWGQENNNREHHKAVIYRDVTFKMPSISAQTVGESIEWQTPELEGTVIGKDGTNPWFKTREFPSQAAAVQYITDEFAASTP